MNELNALKQQLLVLRGRSAALHQTFGDVPEWSAIECLAVQTWKRADRLAAGLSVLVGLGIIDGGSALSRMLWEDLVTLEYVARRPETRLEQLLADAIDRQRQFNASRWTIEKLGREVAPVGIEILKRREAIGKQRNAERKAAKERGEAFPPWTPDEEACLPTVFQRAKEVAADDQCEVVYRTESGSVHFGWAALEDQADGGYQRIVQVLTLGVAAYWMLLAMILDILGLHEAAAALRDDRRAWQEMRTTIPST